MKKSTLALALLLNTLASFAHAHEGHDHDAPTTLKAPKGGIIKALDEARVEVVSKKSEVMIHFYDKEMKPRKADGFKIEATAELPRSKKVEPVKFEPKGDSLSGNFDAKGSHRYTLKLAVTDSVTGRTDKISFTIEPRK